MIPIGLDNHLVGHLCAQYNDQWTTILKITICAVSKPSSMG